MYTIADYIDENGNVPTPPAPAFCLLKDGKPICNYTAFEDKEKVLARHNAQGG